MKVFLQEVKLNETKSLGMGNKIERELLSFGLILAATYQAIQLTSGVLGKHSWITITIDIVLILTTLLLLYCAKATKHAHILGLIFHLCALPALIYFWNVSGGYSGSVPLFFCIYISFIISTCHGWTLVMALIIYGFIIFTLAYNPIFFDADFIGTGKTIGSIRKTLEFLIVIIIVMIFVSYFKNKFNFYRHNVLKRNKQLQNIAEELQEQNQKNTTQQEEIKTINENLESIIAERIKEIEEKNKDLSEYAFINAHLLRAPLSRVLGLVDLMALDVDEGTSANLALIKANAKRVDMIIKKINDTLY